MVTKKILIVISSTVVIGLLASCGIETKSKGGVEGIKTETTEGNEIAANFLPTIDISAEKNETLVHYKVKNISGQTKKLTFPTGLEADYIVYDQAGKKVKQFSDEVASTQAIREITLENNQEMTNDFAITDLPNGQYKIEVFLTAKEEEAKSVTNLIIKNSFAKGSGTYVGQMDPHTIEIDMEGKKVAYQLSDEARNQLSSLQEGGTVSFHYIENEAGQKVIQMFVEE